MVTHDQQKPNNLQQSDEGKRESESGTHTHGPATLFEQLYPELRALAGHQIKGEWRKDHTMQPTDLVNEVFLKLTSKDPASWKSRSEFKCHAARAMRVILCDHARKRNARKRGGGQAKLTLITDLVITPKDNALDPLVLDELLKNLAENDERAAQVVEMRFFGGMTVEEVADVLQVSKRTIENDWTFARTWLYSELNKEDNVA